MMRINERHEYDGLAIIVQVSFGTSLRPIITVNILYSNNITNELFPMGDLNLLVNNDKMSHASRICSAN